MTDLSEIEGWLNLKWEYIPDKDDKILECQYFLQLASVENEINKFRWLISAFLNAAYSYFEICALNVHHAFFDEHLDKYVPDQEAIIALEKYVAVEQRAENFVKTKGTHEITKELYRIRKSNTHYNPLTISPSVNDTLNGFELNLWGQPPKNALKFCEEVMSLIVTAQAEIGAA